jgi:hypothetical protein
VKPDRLLVLRYTLGGKTYLETFGYTSEGKTELEAEQKITEFRANYRAGKGPICLADERDIERRATAEEEARQRREITVEQLISHFIEDHGKRKKRSWQEDERALRKDLEPWANWRVKDVTRRDAKGLLDAIDLSTLFRTRVYAASCIASKASGASYPLAECARWRL